MGDYISKAGLKGRGWTDKGISQFLPTWDKEAPNPYYRKASPMKLYLMVRVEEIEQSEPFKAFQEASLNRKNGAAKAVVTKKAMLMAELNSWKIVVKSKPLEDVRKNAIREYNNHQASLERDDGYFASPNSNKDFLDRITVNQLRHSLSNYERRLDALFGKVGTHQAYPILHKKVMEAIADKYPELATECQRQIARKEFNDSYQES